MNRFLCTGLVGLCVLLSGGCANLQPMALDRSTQRVDTHEKSMVLLAVELYRDDDSRFAPHPVNLIFCRLAGC